MMLIISVLPFDVGVYISRTINEMLSYKVIRCLFGIWSGILISRSIVIKSPIVDTLYK